MFGLKAIALITGAIIGITAIACGRGVTNTQPQPRFGGMVTEAVTTNAASIQPLLASDSASMGLISMVYAPLLRFTPNVALEGELAETYTFADDGSRITMTLRSNAQWSDGTPITSSDVVFTWQRAMDPSVKFPYRSLYDGVFASVEAPDPRTVVFNLKGQCGPALVTAGELTPLPKHIFESVDINDNPYNSAPPVSSGPWKLQEWAKDSHVIFTANEKYWAGRPNLDTYVLKTVPDQTVAYTQFLTSEVDVATVEPIQFDDASKLSHANTFRFFTLGAAWDYIGFNLRDPRFQDPRVRQALAHSVDTPRMMESIGLGFAKAQYSIFPVTSPVFTDEVTKYDYDPSRARELLTDAGWTAGPDGVMVKDGKPFEVRLFTNTGSKRREQVATRSQEYFRQVGVKANLIMEEFAAVNTRINRDHDFDLAVRGFVAGTDPNGQSNVWKKDSPQNAIGYENPAVEDLFQKGAAACSMDERRPYYHQVQQVLAKDAPFIYLWTAESAVGVNKRIDGPAPGPLPLRWNVAEWSVN